MIEYPGPCAVSSAVSVFGEFMLVEYELLLPTPTPFRIHLLNEKPELGVWLTVTVLPTAYQYVPGGGLVDPAFAGLTDIES